MRAFYRFVTVSILSLTSLTAFAGTTGKIAGIITDARSGDKLPSVNVVVEGTTLGTVTNQDGYYVILNVPPGRYRVKASLVGYTPYVATNVRVDIDQTTTQNFTVSEEAVTGEEVTVVAQRPVIQKDVAASRANIEIQDVQKLPVTTVTQAIGLQAGIQGLSARGGFVSETAFIVDGATQRDPRTNAPYTGVSMLAVEDVQVQTGGFSAEYGQVRSGIMNVVTKEGSKSKYTIGFMGRYSGAQPKHFGNSIYDRNSYWIRPYVEDPVAWLGTTAVNPATGQPYWDRFMQMQYPSFEGWNSIAKKNVGTAMEMSPQALQHLFEWQYRRQAEIMDADYNFDLSFGGPFPVVSEELGNLRFFGTFRKTQNMYLVPLSDNALRDYNGSLKLTSDLKSDMKLTVEGQLGRTTGTNNNNSGQPGLFQTPEDIGSVMNRVSYIDTRIFATDYWAPSRIDYASFNAKLAQTLGPKSYYEASVSMFRSAYHTNPGAGRNTAKIYKFGNNYYVDESPFGFDSLPNPANGLSTIRFGVGFSNSRDTSIVTTYTAKFDLTTQLDKLNEVKAGVEIDYTDDDIHYGLYDAYLKSAVFANSYHRFPILGAGYVKDKLEFEGMIADLGVRFEYLNPQGKWYDYDPYNLALSANGSGGIDTLLTKAATKKQFLVSPRVGISFPISEDAKLFFNYGHFRQLPTPDNLFLFRQSSFDKSIVRISDPNAPVPRTVSYELGYEHSIAEQYLLRAAAYYKDVIDETQLVNYTNRNGSVDYTRVTSNGYRDIRGFELTASKNRGNWVQGFINYTYDVRSSGYFGVNHYFQNALQQSNYTLINVQQNKPIPQPYARLNLDLFTPREWGPELIGTHPLGDIRLNVIGSWSNGEERGDDGGARGRVPRQLPGRELIGR
ncbi:MAG TPA: TonB-dependent receptor, partial [Bacteroidota bacterium]